MQILDILRASRNGETPENIAKAFGLNRQASDTVTEGLVDELSHALERNTLSRGGVSELVDLVGHGNHVQYLEGDADPAAPETKVAGDALLAQILGTKHQSRGVADRVARQSGVSSDVIRRMLPAIAAMMAGGMEKQLGGELADVAQRFGAGTEAIAPQQPLPIPGDNLDYGSGRGGSQRSPFDDLSDMIRRGGRSSSPGGGRTLPRGGQGQGGASGSALSQIVRQIFGNLFGFQSKGVVSWIIQLIVFRIGWPILKSIFRRMFLGR